MQLALLSTIISERCAFMQIPQNMPQIIYALQADTINVYWKPAQFMFAFIDR